MHFTSKINKIFFIAEVGSNHEGNFNDAKKTVLSACKSDADVVKLQIFTANNLVAPKYDRKRFKHFKKLELSIKQNIELCKIIKKYKKKCSASIWDAEQIKNFDKYVDIYKIGSGDIHNFEIIQKIIQTKKPIIISTGLSNFKEIEETLDFIKTLDKQYLKKKVALLYCNTAYPTPIEDIRLGTIKYFNEKFNLTTGYSDHTIGEETLIYSYLFGAEIVEKHFSLNPKLNTFRDHQISFNKEDTNIYLKKIEMLHRISEIKKNDLSKSEILQDNITSFRRSIYAKKNIKKGETLDINKIISLRPYKGKSSKFFFKIMKSKSKKNYKIGELFKDD
jgi:N-acetylneuraminate synthase/N,N'-diacetyllegionaminate synthase